MVEWLGSEPPNHANRPPTKPPTTKPPNRPTHAKRQAGDRRRDVVHASRGRCDRGPARHHRARAHASGAARRRRHVYRPDRARRLRRPLDQLRVAGHRRRVGDRPGDAGDRALDGADRHERGLDIRRQPRRPCRTAARRARLSRRDGDRHGPRDDRPRRHPAVGVPPVHRRRHRRLARRGQRDGRRVLERAAAEPRRRAHGGRLSAWRHRGRIDRVAVARRRQLAVGVRVRRARLGGVHPARLVPHSRDRRLSRAPSARERVGARQRGAPATRPRDGDRPPRAEPRRATRAAVAALHSRPRAYDGAAHARRTSRTS